MSTAQTNIPKKPEKLNEASTSSDTASRLCECSGNTDTGGREKLPGEGCSPGWAVGRTLGMGTGKGIGNWIGKGMDTGDGIGRCVGTGMGTGIGTGTGMGTDADISCGKESADNRAS